MFSCKDLLTLPSLSKAKLLSGAGGMERGIRWVYKPEDMHFAKWVKGRELMIISTPVINSRDFELKKLIYEAVKLNLAGAVLLVGEKYIDKIPREVLSYSDEKSFPLFAISGDIPLIDIFEEIGHAIAYYDNKDEVDEDVLSNIIFGNDINIDALSLKCEMLDYDLTLPQMMFVFHIESPNPLQSYDKEVMGEKIKRLFEQEKLPCLLSKYSNSYVGLIKVHPKYKRSFQNIYEAFNAFLQEYNPKIKCLLGLGKGYDHLEKLQLSFQEASRCIMLAGRMGKKSGCYDYNDLGFLNLLYELENPHLIKEFIESTIGPLIRYDAENNTELVETLKVYIENNTSLLHTAEVMHTHRNTIKYRVGRIEEISGKDISQAMNRLELMNAILCYRICNVI